MTAKIHNLGIWQTMFWTVGMLFMTISMSLVGLMGSPRRTEYTTYGESATALGWDPYLLFVGAGGTLLFAGVVLMVYIVFNLMFFAPKGYTEFMAASDEGLHQKPKWTENWGLWVVLAIVIISMGYVVPIIDIIENAPPGSPPIRTW